MTAEPVSRPEPDCAPDPTPGRAGLSGSARRRASEPGPPIGRLATPRGLTGGLAVRRLGLVAMLLLVVGPVAWAGLARLTGAIVATGLIEPDRPILTVAHPRGGLIREILVQDGAPIARGAPLLRLSDPELESRRPVLETQRDTLLARVVRLQAEAGGQTRMEPARLPADALPEAAHQAFRDPSAGLRQALDAEAVLFRQRRRQWAGQDAGLAADLAAALRRARALEAQAALIGQQRDVFDRQAARQAQLVARGTVPRDRADALEQSRLEVDARVADTAMRLQEARDTIRSLRARAAAARAGRAAAIAADLRDTQQRLTAVMAELAALNRRLEALVLKAPQAGMVQLLPEAVAGAVLRPAQPVLRIVPPATGRRVALRISPHQAGQIRVGSLVRMSLRGAAGHSRDLNGRVAQIDPAPVAASATGPLTVRVLIAPNPEDHAILAAQPLGEPVTVFVETGTRRAADWLLAPVTTVLGRAMREP